MTNEAKIITISLISMLLIGLFVVPMTEGGDGGAVFKQMQPPEDSIISSEFQAGTGIGGIVDQVAGIVKSITWFFGTIGALILSGFSGGPILQLVNFVFTVMLFVAIIKMLPWT